MRRIESARRLAATGWAALGALCITGALGCQTTSQMAETPETPEPPEKQVVEPVKPAPKPITTADLETVYFELDEYLLDEKARTALKKNASLIGDHPEWGKILVEGHCDERGSEEYNMVLGKRRAAEVAKYLKDLGVPEARLTTVSFGEAKPAVQGGTEQAWKWNRRSVFLRAGNMAKTQTPADAEWTAAQ